jgi:hypothetical protein
MFRDHGKMDPAGAGILDQPATGRNGRSEELTMTAIDRDAQTVHYRTIKNFPTPNCTSWTRSFLLQDQFDAAVELIRAFLDRPPWIACRG